MGVEVTGDEVDRRLEGMREKRKTLVRRAEQGETAAAVELSERTIELDQTAIHNPNPKYCYRLGNREHKGRLGVLKGIGYQVVPPDAPEQLVMGVEQDGGQVHGDLVLMRTPVENYERRRKDKRIRYQMQAGAVLEQTKENINRIAREGGVVGPHKDAAFDESSDT